MRVNYPQLDDLALGLLKDRLGELDGNKAELARELGIGRSSVSLALAGRYPADTGKLRALIIEKLADQVVCPHLGVDLAPAACKALRERPLSAASASRADAKHWQACQRCHQNPARQRLQEEAGHV